MAEEEPACPVQEEPHCPVIVFYCLYNLTGHFRAHFCNLQFHTYILGAEYKTEELFRPPEREGDIETGKHCLVEKS